MASCLAQARVDGLLRSRQVHHIKSSAAPSIALLCCATAAADGTSCSRMLFEGFPAKYRTDHHGIPVCTATACFSPSLRACAHQRSCGVTSLRERMGTHYCILSPTTLHLRKI